MTYPAMFRAMSRSRAVAFVTVGTGPDLDTANFAAIKAGDVEIGFTCNFTASARPISNAGAIAFTGATSPSATSAGNAGWIIAPADATPMTCSVATASRFQVFGFTGARSLYGAAIQVVTGTAHTIPAVKPPRHGGRFFVSTISETAGRTVSADNLGLGAVNSSSISGVSRHQWVGPPTLASYPGGNFQLNLSAECWTIYGWAV
jgi:hypothetical protein